MVDLYAFEPNRKSFWPAADSFLGSLYRRYIFAPRAIHRTDISLCELQLFYVPIATRHRKQLMTCRSELFLLAGALPGEANEIDLLQPAKRAQPAFHMISQLAEEGSKFLSIANWALHWCQVSAFSIMAAKIAPEL